jgi:hypothetical protein
VRARKVLDVVFGLLVASWALYALFPRFRNDLTNRRVHLTTTVQVA